MYFKNRRPLNMKENDSILPTLELLNQQVIAPPTICPKCSNIINESKDQLCTVCGFILK